MLQRSIRTAVTQQRSLDRLYIQKAAFAGLAISQKGIYQPRLAADRSTRISPLLSRFASSDTSSSPPPSTSASEESSSPSTAASTPEANSQSSDDRFDAAASEELLQAPGSTASQPIGRIQRRLSITFTCTVPDCGERSSHEFSRQAYEKGIVLVQCPKCDSRHLIADHLGWFDSDDLTQGGKYRTIEDLLASKGEKVARARVNADGTLEYAEEHAE